MPCDIHTYTQDSDQESNSPITDQPHVHFQLDVNPSSQISDSTATTNGIDHDFGLTFEQEQTADQLMADIQSAVDEMLQDFQFSPVPDDTNEKVGIE